MNTVALVFCALVLFAVTAALAPPVVRLMRMIYAK